MSIDLNDMPAWYRHEPQGPHRASVGLVPGTDKLAAYCRRDRQAWPCETEEARLKREGQR